MSQNIPSTLAIRIAAQTVSNILRRRPICIALEVTHNCTANCRHCDKGPKVEDNPVGAGVYKKVCDELAPGVIQIAGGEPLKRNDIVEIVRALYRPNRPPFLVLVTNASLLNKEKYLELREAGIRQYSISLDFPDSRHDDFRRIPGLFSHLDHLIPELLAFGHGDVVINCCITRANYPYLVDIARKVSSWGAKLNFSTYTDMRTRDTDLNLKFPDDTQKFDKIIDEIYSGRDGTGCVMTSRKVLTRFRKFYENGNMVPGCRTGDRFLVVNPDGRLTPCAMIFETRYDSLAELKREFARGNNCGGCYVSIRANTEKSTWELLTDNLRVARLSRKSALRHI